MIDLTIKNSDGTGMQILALSGEFDLFDKEHVLDLLPRLLATDSPGLIIDLTGIKLLTSAGIEVLIRYHETFKQDKKRVGIIIDHNDYLMKKFRNLGMFEGTGLEIYTTVEEAVAAIGGR